MTPHEHDLETRGIALAAQMLYEAHNLEGFQLLREEVKRRTSDSSLDCKQVLNSGWISVSDRLPDAIGDYLTFWECADVSMRYVEIDTFEGGKFFNSSSGCIRTHWMPLPAAPLSGDKETK